MARYCSSSFIFWMYCQLAILVSTGLSKGSVPPVPPVRSGSAASVGASLASPGVASPVHGLFLSLLPVATASVHIVNQTTFWIQRRSCRKETTQLVNLPLCVLDPILVRCTVEYMKLYSHIFFSCPVQFTCVCTWCSSFPPNKQVIKILDFVSRPSKERKFSC
jgi:hypothetical protein